MNYHYTKHKLKVLLYITIIFGNTNMVQCLNPESQISILTFKPGDELYTIFGHTALRVQDTALKIDNVYNFGTFDFSSPFFYLKFFGGKLNYFLSLTGYETFIKYSSQENRTIYEQTINLTYEEKDIIYERLNRIYNTQERYYRYDFFYDNCATRIRDLIQSTNTVTLDYDTSKFCCKTFRELIHPYISKDYWVNLGINLALGKEADRLARSFDFMFLPDFVYQIYSEAGLVSKMEPIIDYSGESENTGLLSLILLIIIVVTIISLILINQTRKFTFVIYHSIISLLGLFLLSLSMFSDNSAFRDNFNILGTLPALLVLLTRGRVRKTIEVAYLFELIIILAFRRSIYSGFSWTIVPWISLLIIIYFVDLQIIKKLRNL